MKTILVVEDDKNQRLLYEKELSLEGYNIIIARDGLEAIKKGKGTCARFNYHGYHDA